MRRAIKRAISRLVALLKLDYECLARKRPIERIFVKARPERVKWTRNRFRTEQGLNLYVTPTNHPRISYLDLAEFSIDVRSQFFEVEYNFPRMNHLYEQMEVGEQYCLEFTPWYTKHHAVDDQLEYYYRKRIMKRINIERERHVMISLLRRWNADRQLRHMDYMARMELDVKPFYINQTNIIIDRCRNPEKVVDFFRKVCSKITGRCFLFCEPWYYLEFFILHAYKTNFNARSLLCHYIRHEKWFSSTSPIQMHIANLVWTAFREYLNDIIANRLPFIVSTLDTPDDNDDILWPLPGMPGAPLDQVNTCQFRNRVIYDMALGAYSGRNNSITVRDMPPRIRLVYSVLPLPYAPEEDMRNSLYSAYDYAADRMEFQDLWSHFISVFPKDCIGVRGPRSLKHLSRCSVRQYFANLLKVARYVPLDLAKYLLLDE